MRFIINFLTKNGHYFTKTKVIKRITNSNPINPIIKNQSAIVSKNLPLLSLLDFMEINENIHERVNSKATIEVNSSNKVPWFLFVIRNDVITMRQKPRRFPEVFNMCCAVLLDIVFNLKGYKKS